MVKKAQSVLSKAPWLYNDPPPYWRQQNTHNTNSVKTCKLSIDVKGVDRNIDIYMHVERKKERKSPTLIWTNLGFSCHQSLFDDINLSSGGFLKNYLVASVSWVFVGGKDSKSISETRVFSRLTDRTSKIPVGEKNEVCF